MSDTEMEPAVAEDNRMSAALCAHEALDRTWIVLNMFEREVAAHRAVTRNAEAARLAELVHTSLFELYQHLGSV